MKAKTNSHSISNVNHAVTNDLPYINLNSPQIKEQVEKMNEILKKVKSNLPNF